MENETNERRKIKKDGKSFEWLGNKNLTQYQNEFIMVRMNIRC